MTTAGFLTLGVSATEGLWVTVGIGTVLVVPEVLTMLSWFLSFSKAMGAVALVGGALDVTGFPMISIRAGVLYCDEILTWAGSLAGGSGLLETTDMPGRA